MVFFPFEVVETLVGNFFGRKIGDIFVVDSVNIPTFRKYLDSVLGLRRVVKEYIGMVR
jgi:hypothetical protein